MKLVETHIAHGYKWKREDITGWLLSEKLDGCRALWDGEMMWTHSGREIRLPAHFRGELPNCLLDGELWAGRGGFRAAVDATKHGRFTPAIRFMVFDAPGGGGYAARLAAARVSLAGSALAQVVEIEPAKSTQSAFHRMKCIHVGGGEGLIARRPESAWVIGRNHDILKLKYEEQAQMAMLMEMD